MITTNLTPQGMSQGVMSPPSQIIPNRKDTLERHFRGRKLL